MDVPDTASAIPEKAAAISDTMGDLTKNHSSTTTPSLRPKTRRRASSLLGSDIPGDTTAPALSTANESPASREASRTRRRALSKGRSDGKMLPSQGNYFTWYREVSYRHTWVNPLVAILIVVAIYLPNPTPSNPVHDCLFLAYPVAKRNSKGEVMYDKGLRDLKFVFFYTFFFSFTREFIMQRVFRPLAKIALPPHLAKSKAKCSRFMEQAYTALYICFFGPYGLYVMYTTENLWYFNSRAFWETHPDYLHNATFKAYYLLQWSFWAQQAIVLMLQLEKPRKDFKELVWHHIITLTLIVCSWRFHYSYCGVAVFVTHDISDFFLATSKILNYMDSKLIAPYFTIFIAAWVYLRHYCNLIILWSMFTEYRYVGVWELNWEKQIYKCRLAQVIMIALLGGLQAVNLFWLFLILRIAYRIVKSQGEEFVDERSEDEDEDEIEEEEEEEEEREELKKMERVDETPKIALNGEMVAGDVPVDVMNGNGELRRREVAAVGPDEE